VIVFVNYNTALMKIYLIRFTLLKINLQSPRLFD
jgi:hypothetical protein